ncbi:MAG: sporulation protein YqfD [Clostridia bacterium]|nr:sporulation protein YqfD [Clostridia bacterium]
MVQIAETTQKPEIIPLNEYCNIVSNKTAQITKITANSGTIVVKPRRHCNSSEAY